VKRATSFRASGVAAPIQEPFRIINRLALPLQAYGIVPEWVPVCAALRPRRQCVMLPQASIFLRVKRTGRSVGLTSPLARRFLHHREGQVPEFACRYG
jgi:hypothetical protein